MRRNPFSILFIPVRAVAALWKLLVTYLPGPTGNRLRNLYYRGKFRRFGSNVTIDMGVTIDGPELISIGNNVYIDKYCIIQTGKSLQGLLRRKENSMYQGEEGELWIGDNVHIVQFCVIMAYGGVRIEDNCTLSAGSKIYSLSNLPTIPEDPSRIVSIMPYDQAPFIISPVVLFRNVWLGLDTKLMPGTSIGPNSFVISNSLVIGNYPENSVLSGQPATRIRDRFSRQ